MATRDLGTLEQVLVREIWPHEGKTSLLGWRITCTCSDRSLN